MHGAGNDFIVVNENNLRYIEQYSLVQAICNRRFGIGSDGIIGVKSHEKYDFEMVFYNPDGTSGMFCGNGARCALAYAYQLDIISEQGSFWFIDRVYPFQIGESTVSIQMKPIATIKSIVNGVIIDSGALHYVEFVENLQSFNVFRQGRERRYHEAFQPEGANANFIELVEDSLQVRTYERGVEKETLACGTGITASAIAYFNTLEAGMHKIAVQARGGNLTIRATKVKENTFENIFMEGPAQLVFEGSIDLEYLMQISKSPLPFIPE